MAAHFVHGIPAMLQIKGTTPAGRVIAITSPSAHNGKTSISLALGVSFAGAHSNTLLIDCDFIGLASSDRTKAVARPRWAYSPPSRIDRRRQAARRPGRCRPAWPAAWRSVVEIGYLPSEKMDAAWWRKRTAPSVYWKPSTAKIWPMRRADGDPGSVDPAAGSGQCRAYRQFVAVDAATGAGKLPQEVRHHHRRYRPDLGSLEAAMVATQADDVVMILSTGENRARPSGACGIWNRWAPESPGLSLTGRHPRLHQFRRGAADEQEQFIDSMASRQWVGGGAGLQSLRPGRRPWRAAWARPRSSIPDPAKMAAVTTAVVKTGLGKIAPRRMATTRMVTAQTMAAAATENRHE